MSQDNPNCYLNIKLTKSPIGFAVEQKATVAALGLRKVGAAVVLPATSSVLGMTRKVRHLLTVSETSAPVKTNEE